MKGGDASAQINIEMKKRRQNGVMELYGVAGMADYLQCRAEKISIKNVVV
jgi:hypothetical protein